MCSTPVTPGDTTLKRDTLKVSDTIRYLQREEEEEEEEEEVKQNEVTEESTHTAKSTWRLSFFKKLKR
jgi:hypothetical protein